MQPTYVAHDSEEQLTNNMFIYISEKCHEW